MTPLPLATSKRLPSGVTRTEVGYQPVGMKPSERLLPGRLISNTATIFTFALATNRNRSSGDNARLLGVEPGGEFGKSAAQIVSIFLPVAASSSVTVFRLALATKRILPDRFKTISFGCSSVCQRAMTWFDLRSITAT